MATSRQLAVNAAKIMKDKKAKDIKILDLKALNFITDYFVICSTENERQSKAIADAIHMEMKQKGLVRMNVEGYSDGKWLLEDFGDFVAHIFMKDARKHYDLESLWPDAKVIKA